MQQSENERVCIRVCSISISVIIILSILFLDPHNIHLIACHSVTHSSNTRTAAKQNGSQITETAPAEVEQCVDTHSVAILYGIPVKSPSVQHNSSNIFICIGVYFSLTQSAKC